MNLVAMRDFSARGAAVGEGLWPAVVLVEGVEYVATVTEPVKVTGELIAGGTEVTGRLVFRVRVDRMAEPPKPGAKVRWKRPEETDWRETSWVVEEDPRKGSLDVEWVVVCEVGN